MAGADFLGKQLGPMPVGMWFLVGFGGLGLGYVINKNMAKNAAAAAEPSTQQLTESGVGVGGGQFQYDPIQTVPTDTTPETNQSWGIKVTNWLIGKGMSATNADNAVRKYLSGNVLSVTEKGMLDLALIQFGVPPEPLPVVDQPDTPTPSTPIVVPAVSNLSATGSSRRVTFRWSFPNSPAIGGFLITITDLKRKRVVVRQYIGASARQYTYTAPSSWTRSSRSKVQIWIRPFRGGWAQPVKNYGPGRGASATPII